MFHVKNMKANDFEFAVSLTDTMGWNLVEEDFEFMIELESDGCFVLFDDSDRIGIATTIIFDKVGWLGNVIVTKKYRGRGAGSLLVKHSLKHLANKYVETVGIYAYIDRIPFYRSVGFEYDSDFVYIKGKGSSSPTGSYIREAGEDDLREIVNFDSLCFGTSRRKLMEPILLDSSNLCYVAIDREDMLGFVVAKVYEGVAEVGPLICQQGCSNIAIDLLKTTLNTLEGYEISMCIQKKESSIINAIMMFGFSEAFYVAKMFYGKKTESECIYMAESLERG